MAWLFVAIVAIAVGEPSSAAVNSEKPDASGFENTRQSSALPIETKPVQSFDPNRALAPSEHVYSYSGSGYRDRQFRYQLFVPPKMSKGKKYPLLVWLHGWGQAGNDNISQLRHMNKLILPFQKDASSPFFVLATQCPHDNSVWTTRALEADDMINVTESILAQVLEKYPVDVERVSLVGISSGGSGSWELAERYPERFSAISPISAGTVAGTAIDQLTEIPVWAFHSIRDKDAPIEDARNDVLMLAELGGFARLTEVEGKGAAGLSAHDAWTQAFEEHDLLTWLLNQRRAQGKLTSHWNWLRHEYLNLTVVLPRAAPLIAMVICIVVCKRERRKRVKFGQMKLSEDIQARPAAV
jgi:pimeloyl-ACP methyl ester carboxylesterase